LYQITGNKTIAEFQNIVHPVMTFVKENSRNTRSINIKLKEEGRIVTHQDLLHYLKENMKTVIEEH
jgi:hypothetical protein